MSDLLQLVLAESAEALHLQVGRPPVIDLEGLAHTIEGPPLTQQNIRACLREIANTRQVRELRERGELEFVYLYQGRAGFRVEARIKDDNVRVDVRRLAA